jgi:hypothetical protein|nr:MAG TPA: tail-collar fiber protein [Bacteriophage sp.]
MATAIREQDTLAALRGAVHLAVYKNGKLLFEETDHNLIVTTGREKLARLIGGDYTGCITKVGVGTGSAPASDTDTGLTDAVLVPVQSTSYAGTKARFDFIIGNGDANGLLIRELGLFFGDGVMFSRRVRKSIIGKEDDISITGYWEIYF